MQSQGYNWQASSPAASKKRSSPYGSPYTTPYSKVTTMPPMSPMSTMSTMQSESMYNRAGTPTPRSVSPLPFKISYDALDERLSQLSKPKAVGASPSGSSSSSLSISSILVQLSLVVLCVGLGVHGGVYHVQQNVVSELEVQYQETFAMAQSVQRSLQEKLHSMESTKSDAVRRERYMNATLQNMQNTQEELMRAVHELVDGKKSLHQAIQMESKRLLLEKYGAGPHRLEMQLAFHPDSNNYEHNHGSSDKIIIEMAPADLMPHSVYMFLEQVSNGLWDGTSFHRNAHHLLQTGPVSNFLTADDAISPAQKFRDANLNNLLFSEYSPAFPHVKYTLGFAGRPGGPDFYINTVDNNRVHGPSISGDVDDDLMKQIDPESAADPCFAKVIDGFEAIQRLQGGEVQTGGFRRLKHFVAIKHIRMLPN